MPYNIEELKRQLKEALTAFYAARAALRNVEQELKNAEFASRQDSDNAGALAHHAYNELAEQEPEEEDEE